MKCIVSILDDFEFNITEKSKIQQYLPQEANKFCLLLLLSF